MGEEIMSKKYSTKKSLELIPLIRRNFKPDKIFRAWELGLLTLDDAHTIKMKLRRIKNQEHFGIIIFKVGNCNSKLWFYKKVGP